MKKSANNQKTEKKSAAKPVQRQKRGGARPGAGRPASAIPRIRLETTILPESRLALDRLAHDSGKSIGQVIDGLVSAAERASVGRS